MIHARALRPAPRPDHPKPQRRVSLFTPGLADQSNGSPGSYQRNAVIVVLGFYDIAVVSAPPQFVDQLIVSGWLVVAWGGGQGQSAPEQISFHSRRGLQAGRNPNDVASAQPIDDAWMAHDSQIQVTVNHGIDESLTRVDRGNDAHAPGGNLTEHLARQFVDLGRNTHVQSSRGGHLNGQSTQILATLNQVMCSREQSLPLVRQSDASRASLEESNSKMALEPLDPLRHRRLRHPQVLSGMTKVPCLGYRREEPEMAKKIHRPIIRGQYHRRS